MAALNKQQVMAGGLALAAMIGLCSCSSNTLDPSFSGGTTVEPTQAPISEDQAEMPAWWNDGSVQEVFGDIDVFPAEYGVPACYLPGYVYSDVPQGAHEQWIFDNFPLLWEHGVRALSESVTGSAVWDGEVVYREFESEEEAIEFYRENPDPMSGVISYPDPGPVALVQYYNGKRYEGTASMPLGFFMGNPEAVTAESGYRLTIGAGERPGGYRSDVEISLRTPTPGTGTNSPFYREGAALGDGPLSVESAPLTTDEYIDWVRSGEYLTDHAQALGIPSSQVRALYPNEFTAYITFETGTLAGSKYADEIDDTHLALGSARGILIYGDGSIIATN